MVKTKLNVPHSGILIFFAIKKSLQMIQVPTYFYFVAFIGSLNSLDNNISGRVYSSVRYEQDRQTLSEIKFQGT